MRILITGGAGFIGAALANRLISDGHKVIVLDNMSAGNPQHVNAGADIVCGTIHDTPQLWRLLRGIDCVYHLAARVSVAESNLYPREYNLTNLIGTTNLLEAMRDVGTPRIVFSSSGAVYGEQPQQLLHERMLPNPRSPYAVSKLAAEDNVRAAARCWHISAISLRLFNVYGPHQQLPVAYAPVIPKWLYQSWRGAPLVLAGSGEQTRDFIYIEDAVEALVQAIDHCEGGGSDGEGGDVINVGSGVEVSLLALAELLRTITQHNSPIQYASNYNPGVMRMCANLELAKSRLKFVPRYGLMDGLEAMIERDHRFRPE